MRHPLRVPTSLVPLLAIAVMAACNRTPNGPPAGPTVALVDSVVLIGPDTFPRPPGSPDIALSESGELVVEPADQLLHFDRTGRFVGVLGHPGESPGELRDVSGVTVLPGDSVVAVVSTARGRIIR